MSDNNFKQADEKTVKPNVVSVRVDERTFRRLMAIAHKYADGSMSIVAKLCIDSSIDSVEEYLKASYELKKATLKLPNLPKT